MCIVFQATGIGDKFVTYLHQDVPEGMSMSEADLEYILQRLERRTRPQLWEVQHQT